MIRHNDDFTCRPVAIVAQADMPCDLAQLAAIVRSEHEQVISLQAESLNRALRIGAALNAAKKLVRHGEWMAWLEAHVSFKKSVACEYMLLDRQRERLKDKFPDAGNLSIAAALTMLCDDGGDENEPETDSAEATEEGVAVEPADDEPSQSEQEAIAANLRQLHDGVETDAEGNVIPSEAPPPDLLDDASLPVPERLLPAWATLEKFRELERLLRQAQKLAADLGALPGGEWYTQDALKHRTGKGEDGEPRAYNPHIQNAINDLKHNRPFASACPYCEMQADRGPKCPYCKGLGWVRRSTWNNAPPEYREGTTLARREEDE